MLGRTDHRMRMVAVLLIFSVFGTAAMVRLGQWQVVEAPWLAVKAEQTLPKPAKLLPPRAEIQDRDGLTLAQTTSLDMLEAYPNLIPADRIGEIVETLAEIMDLRSTTDRQVYLDRLSTGSQWVWLEREITPEQSIEVRLAMDEGLLPGIGLTAKQVRSYPRRGGQGSATLASHLLGFVDADGRGMYGVERSYDARLSGETRAPADIAALGSFGGDLGTSYVPPLRLTIDQGLQKQLERELTAARTANQAKSVSAIVMDPFTGEILASASVPGYDANDYAEVARRGPSQLRDRVISDTYEPGSVMKIFTAAAALDKGKVKLGTRIRDQSALRFGRNRVRNADKGTKGSLSVKDVIALSRNVATAKIAQRLAPGDTQKAARILYSLWERVGIVGRTGVDLASEEAGTAHHPGQVPWQPVDLANRAFGQGVSVTLIQLATAYATIVNGGFHVQPHVVIEGEAADAQPQRVLSAKVARQARQILEHVTGSVSHYAAGSLVPGYLIGGKTGTAQIWDTSRGAWKNRFNHSFVGFVGGDEPEALIAVRIEEPRFRVPFPGAIDLKIESYELFRLVAMGAIKHLGIERSSDPDAGLPILGTQAARSLTPERTRRAKVVPDKRKQPTKTKTKTKARQAEAAAVGGDPAAEAAAGDRRGSRGSADSGRDDLAGGTAQASAVHAAAT